LNTTVVSNTSPLRYLILVGNVGLVEQIFRTILIPQEVERELTDPSAPDAVRQWMLHRPPWLQVRPSSPLPAPHLSRGLDEGEAAAIQLALDLNADFLLMDEFLGRQAAAKAGLAVIGVLGILLESYRRRLINNPGAILGELLDAGFRLSRELIREFEEQVKGIGNG
jgi:predicted nucleic acid-binding protein